jgi:dihydrodipicolinate synthase/N-acetylneuraminate lyase
MSKKIEGLLPIINTPFLDNDEIDAESLKRQIDWVYSFPVKGLD